MGLDVYLYRYDNKADTDAREQEYKRLSDENWKRFGDKKYEQYSDSEKDEIRAANVAVAERLSLDQWGDDKTLKQKIEINSVKYPDHLFKVGYFRSSYNDGGINRILSARIGIDLSGIMGVDGDTYETQPDWSEARRRALSALEQLRAMNVARPYRALFIGPNIFGGDTTVVDEAGALAVFERAKVTHGSDGAYGCRDGDFWMSTPLAVRGAIVGKGVLGNDGIWLVYDDNAENMQWYEQALEIVIETCDYVIAQSDRAKYWMHWSG